MDKVFELISNFVQMFILSWFVTGFFGCKYKEKASYICGMLGAAIVAFIEISIINYIVEYDGIFSLSIVITYVIYARIFLKGNISSHIFICVFSTAIIFTISSALIFIFSYLSKISPLGIIDDFTIWRVIATCLCRLFEFVAFKFIIKVNSNFVLSKKEWAMFIAMPVFTWISVVLMTEITIISPMVLPQMFYIALLMIAINIIIYFFLFKIKEDNQTRIEYELLKMQHNNIRQLEANMKALYDSTYSVKHDLEKHLLAVKTMAENNRCNEVCSYVDRIVENGLNSVQKIVFTSNDVFNAIINTKLAICKERGIIPSINISDVAVEYIESSNIVIIFGNIFDNAIEAAEKTEEKIIILDVRLQGEYVSIYMENSFNHHFSNINLKTTKHDKTVHGIGIKNVRKIVEENDGMIEYFKSEDGMFCCDILLKKHV